MKTTSPVPANPDPAPARPKLTAYPGAMPDARRLTRAELERLRRETREASVQLKMEQERMGRG